MRMMMRPNYKQFNGRQMLKATVPGSSTLDMRLPKQAQGAELMQYQAFLVGAAGGKSAQALGYSGTVGPYLGRAGGGGGGSLMLQGVVADLMDDVPYTVGAAGTQPANAGNNANAPDGTAGGDSTFYDGTFIAHGGKGGIGGDFSGTSSSGSGSGSIGGAGGTNSAGLGAGGVGGDGGFMSWGPGGSPDGGGQTSPTAGTYVGVGGALTHPMPKAIAGGRGGGGGRPDLPSWSPSSPSAGGTGNSGGFPVPGSAASGADGGYGGGGSYEQVNFLVQEYYGSGGTVAGQVRSANGLVAVNLIA